jgi:threonyl-tRNA synthetase
MKELAQQKNPYIRKEVPKKEAARTLYKKGDQYKIELLE